MKRNRKIAIFYRILLPFVDIKQFFNAFKNYFWFIRDYFKYCRKKGNEKAHFLDLFPMLHDKTGSQEAKGHYTYQSLWTFGKIKQNNVIEHVDVGSSVNLISFLTFITKVIYVDIRPLISDFKNFESIAGSVLNLPFNNNSVNSISCLHVAEHIGLGRYGDPLDAEGTKKACKELARVLAKNGKLYFSLPIGKPKVMFNAQRIHTSTQIIEYFNDLQLVTYSGVADDGRFYENISIDKLDTCEFACGFFEFTK